MANNNKIAEKVYISLYITSLTLVASYVIWTRQYTGELSNFSTNTTSFELALLLGFSALGFILAYYFYLQTKDKKIYLFITPWKINPRRLASVFFGLVIAQLIFLIVTDVGRIGSQATNIYSPIFAALNVDALFGFFYILAREDIKLKKIYFWLIVITFLIFKILQGWSGVILLILFFELHVYFKSRKIKPWSRVLIISLLPLFLILSGGKLYHYVFPYKFEIRGLEIDEIDYAESVVNLTNRLTFFPIAVGAYERSDELKLNALNDETSFREFKSFFRPFLPRFLMENKEFRSTNNLVMQAFYPNIESTTSSDMGFVMYIFSVFSSEMIDGILVLILTALLLLINKFVIDSFEQYRGQLNFLYFLLIMKLYYTGSPEIVFSYGSIGVLFLLPLLFATAAIRFKASSK